MAEHRKQSITSNEASTITASGEYANRNISQSAWNKIRLTELKKKQRLTEFNPWYLHNWLLFYNKM